MKIKLNNSVEIEEKLLNVDGCPIFTFFLNGEIKFRYGFNDYTLYEFSNNGLSKTFFGLTSVVGYEEEISEFKIIIDSRFKEYISKIEEDNEKIVLIL